MRAPPDLSCYVIVDVGHDDRRDPLLLLRGALAGGATCVQLRAKTMTARELTALARAALEIARPLGVPVLVNDRVDVAFAAGADGAHVGQEDLPVRDARALLGKQAIVGLSITALDEVHADDVALADYLGVGPIFPTASKPDAAPAIGLDGLRAVRAATDRPIVAIGGISRERVDALVAAGADGVAVLSAVGASADPVAATRAIVARVHEARLARAAHDAAREG